MKKQIDDKNFEGISASVTVVNCLKSFLVNFPWKLAHAEQTVGSGFSAKKRFNYFYPVMVIDTNVGLPDFKIENETPFWKMDEDSWNTVKKRVKAFTEEFDDMPTVSDGDLEEAKSKADGSWLHE